MAATSMAFLYDRLTGYVGLRSTVNDREVTLINGLGVAPWITDDRKAAGKYEPNG